MRGLAVLLFVLLFIASIAFGIWFNLAAPCSDMKWVPGKDIPGRCLNLKN